MDDDKRNPGYDYSDWYIEAKYSTLKYVNHLLECYRIANDIQFFVININVFSELLYDFCD